MGPDKFSTMPKSLAHLSPVLGSAPATQNMMPPQFQNGFNQAMPDFALVQAYSHQQHVIRSENKQWSGLNNSQPYPVAPTMPYVPTDSPQWNMNMMMMPNRSMPLHVPLPPQLAPGGFAYSYNSIAQLAIKDGSSCHQCKRKQASSRLMHCRNEFVKKHSYGKRCCKKKYCFNCLDKFYNSAEADVKADAHWKCPSCTKSCTCAYCSRRRSSGVSVDELQVDSPITSSETRTPIPAAHGDREESDVKDEIGQASQLDANHIIPPC